MGLQHFRLESIGPPVEKGLTKIDTKMGRVSVRLTFPERYFAGEFFCDRSGTVFGVL